MPPLTTAKPAVYRDNVTWLEMVSTLRDKVDEIVDIFNRHSTEEYDSYKDALSQLAEGWRLEFINLREYLDTVVEGVNSEPLIFDPTNGKLLQRVTTVNGNIYDNLRLYAYFAAQYDALNLTAAEYEALDLSARHYDLSVTYPTLNATMES